MKQFEAGKTYELNTSKGYKVKVEKRTAHYATVSGDYNGRFYIYKDNFFGLGEEIMFPTEYKNISYFCFAGHEI